jgi:hypothetical protein
LCFARSISSSPYGRTHVWKRRLPVLPPPVIAHFPQLVVRADGSSFTHYTTSPRPRIELTRDVTNSPVWNAGAWARLQAEEEEEGTGRLGRFERRFGKKGSKSKKNADFMDGLDELLGIEQK